MKVLLILMFSMATFVVAPLLPSAKSTKIEPLPLDTVTKITEQALKQDSIFFEKEKDTLFNLVTAKVIVDTVFVTKVQNEIETKIVYIEKPVYKTRTITRNIYVGYGYDPSNNLKVDTTISK